MGCSIRARFSQTPARRNVFSFALRVEVIRAEGIPSKVFVFHSMPDGPLGETFSEFDHVATPVDFHEIPEDSATDTVPWFRTDSCEMWFRNARDAALAKQMMVDELSDLQKSYDAVAHGTFELQTTLDFTDGGVSTATDVPQTGSD